MEYILRLNQPCDRGLRLYGQKKASGLDQKAEAIMLCGSNLPQIKRRLVYAARHINPILEVLYLPYAGQCRPSRRIILYSCPHRPFLSTNGLLNSHAPLTPPIRPLPRPRPQNTRNPDTDSHRPERTLIALPPVT